jgi:undecaprenyl diphosphate synthase
MHEYSVAHVAIIPDGNRRWATARNKFPWDGHREGVKAFEKVLARALELDIYCLTFWGMSKDNISKRAVREVKYLLAAFSRTLMAMSKSVELKKNDVKVSILGDWRNQFPKALVKLGEKTIEETSDRKKHILNLLFCYDGKSEMIEAFEKARQSKKDVTSPKDFLMTRDLPPVDLVIRTGGDPHLSAGFMMWDTADAQLSFSDKLWPDYTAEDFAAAVNEFRHRPRRYGA